MRKAASSPPLRKSDKYILPCGTLAHNRHTERHPRDKPATKRASDRAHRESRNFRVINLVVAPHGGCGCLCWPTGPFCSLSLSSALLLPLQQYLEYNSVSSPFTRQSPSAAAGGAAPGIFTNILCGLSDIQPLCLYDICPCYGTTYSYSSGKIDNIGCQHNKGGVTKRTLAVSTHICLKWLPSSPTVVGMAVAVVAGVRTGCVVCGGTEYCRTGCWMGHPRSLALSSAARPSTNQRDTSIDQSQSAISVFCFFCVFCFASRPEHQGAEPREEQECLTQTAGRGTLLTPSTSLTADPPPSNTPNFPRGRGGSSGSSSSRAR